ncbi:ABC transporter substrate-binding protein, partial [Burkholderia pseudomallei]|nr:ABC transporter substrate-binding protein [Burkholderia pseudomallei]
MTRASSLGRRSLSLTAALAVLVAALAAASLVAAPAA